MRLTAGLLLGLAALAVAGCGDTPPPGVNPTAWQAALADCRQQARLAFGTPPFGAIGRPSAFVHNTDWEVIQPCMVAKGYPEPPP